MTLLRRPLARPLGRLPASAEVSSRGMRVAVGALIVGLVYAAGRADEARAATRASREAVGALVWRYRVRHGGRCPRDLSAVARDSSRRELPRDGWGEPLGLRCPSPREGHAFDVTSAGPDRIPGGVDAVE